MKKTVYLSALFIWILIKQIIFGIFVSILMRIFILTSIPFIYLFSIYFLFSTNMAVIAVLISCFFNKTKKALVFGIFIFFAF